MTSMAFHDNLYEFASHAQFHIMFLFFIKLFYFLRTVMLFSFVPFYAIKLPFSRILD